MFWIEILDLEKVDQGHELQCCQIRNWLAFLFPMRRTNIALTYNIQNKLNYNQFCNFHTWSKNYYSCSLMSLYHYSSWKEFLQHFSKKLCIASYTSTEIDLFLFVPNWYFVPRYSFCTEFDLHHDGKLMDPDCIPISTFNYFILPFVKTLLVIAEWALGTRLMML